LWLLVLTLYILAGTALAPFHGDEAMQITMSRDYFTAFVNQQPQSLPVSPPYTVDNPAWLRLINGSVNVYTIGLSLHLAGYTENDLPTLWEWPLSYDENIARGHRPDSRMLTVSRLPSAIFLAAGAIVLFGIGWQFSERLPAYIASGLYALSPVILLNGRRAMMEGSVLCFGLLAILLAILICKGRTGWRWWLCLGLSSGLTLASKHSGILFVAVTFGWLILYHLPLRKQHSHSPRPEGEGLGVRVLTQPLIALIVSIVLTVIVFLAASPALWSSPVERFGDLIRERQLLLESQVTAEPTAPTPLTDRLSGIITQPYIQPPVYFEAAFWANVTPIQAEIKAYESSPLSGLHAGIIIGGILSLMAFWGIIITLPHWRTWHVGLLLWLALAVATLLINPLPWQRYYLALYPLATLLTAIGVTNIVTRRTSQQKLA